MKRKIFNSIWGISIIVFLASLVLIFGVSYNYFYGQQEKQLRAETHLAAQGVALIGDKYLKSLNTGNYRLTWIAADGKVIYDNEYEAAKMENHSEREEFKEAIEKGFGESSRYSATLSEKQYYAAEKIADGSVVRISINQKAVWAMMIAFAPTICFVILLALVMSLILASHLSKKIVAPINEIDPFDPTKYIGKDGYLEVEPLLKRIDSQQKQLQRDHAEIEKTALIRQEFTANVSHELKTPLHSISGYAELIENGLAQPENIKDFASKIRTESGRLTKLVGDIIDLTKLDNGGAELRWEECDLYSIAENAVESLEQAAEDAGVTVTLSGTHVAINGIAQHLHSVIYNLCDNAIKYNRRGGRVDISIDRTFPQTEGGEGTAVVKIKDTGIGIPEECLDRVFERFYRVDKSRSKEVGGTGLGLSIVKHALLIHNADIKVSSKMGEGTEFVITFEK